VVTLLVRRRRCELGDAHVTRIETTDETPDRASLAGCIPPLEQNENGRAEPASVDEATEYEPQMQEAALRGLELLRFLFAGQTKGQIERTEP
jgi:hypothetical protein